MIHYKLKDDLFYQKLWGAKKNILKLDNGLLVFKKRTKEKVIVPESNIINLTRKIHETDCGHPGVAKSCEMIQRTYYWPDMPHTIKQVLDECEICSQNKICNPLPRHSLKPMEINGVFLDWHVDFTGPLPETAARNRYIIIFVDRFTKWVEAFSVVQQTAFIAAELLVNKII